MVGQGAGGEAAEADAAKMRAISLIVTMKENIDRAQCELEPQFSSLGAGAWSAIPFLASFVVISIVYTFIFYMFKLWGRTSPGYMEMRSRGSNWPCDPMLQACSFAFRAPTHSRALESLQYISCPYSLHFLRLIALATAIYGICARQRASDCLKLATIAPTPIAGCGVRCCALTSGGTMAKKVGFITKISNAFHSTLSIFSSEPQNDGKLVFLASVALELAQLLAISFGSISPLHASAAVRAISP